VWELARYCYYFYFSVPSAEFGGVKPVILLWAFIFSLGVSHHSCTRVVWPNRWCFRWCTRRAFLWQQCFQERGYGEDGYRRRKCTRCDSYTWHKVSSKPRNTVETTSASFSIPPKVRENFFSVRSCFRPVVLLTYKYIFAIYHKRFGDDTYPAQRTEYWPPFSRNADCFFAFPRGDRCRKYVV